MAGRRQNRQTKRARSRLFEKGLLAALIGAAFLLGPAFFGNSPTLKPVAAGLRTPGWIALGIGLVLLAIYFVLKRREASSSGSRFGVTDGGIEPVLSDKPFAPGGSVPAVAWSPAVFRGIEWRRFEAVCEALFAQGGFETRAQSHGADGGVDIWLHSANASGAVAVVQCKHWQAKPVGVKEMREFFGVMASHQLKRGIYATTSTYTADALQFAKANGINAMDGPALLALIAKRTPEQQQALLAVAYEGEYWRPTCASCGIKLVERARSGGGKPFWGCANYPRCRSTLPMTTG
jgi:restriction system protein